VSEPAWKRTVRRLYFAAFALVFVETVAMLYVTHAAFEAGALAPEGVKTEALINHGERRYVSVEDKAFADRMFDIASIAIPSLVGAAFFAHFVLGVRLFGRP
jgi:hypothetical protein